MKNNLIENNYIKALMKKEKPSTSLVFTNSNTVLAGGMDKDDDKINIEIFLDKDLESDKIERFLSPKQFINEKRFIVEAGELKQTTACVDDNLLIKGNNLVVLHSLKEKYQNKIDVIYIDPPYYFNSKKSHDCFAYNSNFELSTWLVFMKNRLEVARELLCDTGVIFISMNEDGTSHLKLLCDEIFGVDNFIENFNWKKTNTPQNIGFKTRSNIDYILCYEKKKNNNKYSSTKEGGGDTAPLLLKDAKESILVFDTKYINFKNTLIGKTIKRGLLGKNKNEKNSMELLEDFTIGTSKELKLKARFRWNQSYLDNQMLLGTQLFCNTTELAIRYKKTNYDNVLPTTLLDSSDNYGTNEEGTSILVDLKLDTFKNPKPLSLLKNLINMVSKDNKNAIVLDFFGGSGTTGHAVMDLNKEDGGTRKFILVEQMDYIETISAERLKRAMIKYGYNDSFSYCELEESSVKRLKKDLKSCPSLEALKSLIASRFDDHKEINNQIDLLVLNLPKKANKLYEAIKMVIVFYMKAEYDYVPFNSSTADDFSKSFYGLELIP